MVREAWTLINGAVVSTRSGYYYSDAIITVNETTIPFLVNIMETLWLWKKLFTVYVLS